MPAFADATAVRPLGEGRWAAEVDPGFDAPAGPNGGYLAAIVLRAMAGEVADPARPPRSLTLHYLAPTGHGPAEVRVAVLRSGRSLTSLRAELVQGERTCVVALAAFVARDQPTALDYDDAPAPAVPPADAVPTLALPPGAPPIFGRLAVRPCLGPPLFSGADEALTGGWLALAEPEPGPVDAALLALYLDAWLPAPFPRLDRLVACPTIDLTIHFRREAPAGLAPDAPLLGRFSSRLSDGGLFEEEAELWTPDGELLAQARQLALIRPPRA